MKAQPLLHPQARPYFFPGNEIGCLLVHGFTASPHEVKSLADHLHQAHGYSVLGVRLPGHGTDPADMNRSRWQDWLATVEDGYHLLRPNVKHLFVIGYSLGGGLAAQFATRFEFDGVSILAAPYYFPSNTFSSRLLKRFPWISLLKPFAEKGHGAKWFNPDALTKRYKYNVNPIRATLELDLMLDHLQTTINTIQIPTQLIYSEHDLYITHDHMDHYKKAIPHAETNLVTDCNHHLLEDGKPEIVFNLITDFISKTLDR